MRNSFISALSKAGLPSRRRWQRAIDELDLLAPMRLLRLEIGPGNSCTAGLGEVPTRFSCEKVPLEALLDRRSPDLASAWSHAYRFGDSGNRVEAAAAAIACVACVLATGGALHRPGAEPIRDLPEARRELDFDLAGALRLEEAYLDRYPADRQTETVGPSVLEIIAHRT